MKTITKLILTTAIFATSGWTAASEDSSAYVDELSLSDDVIDSVFGEGTATYFEMCGKLEDNTLTLAKVTRKSGSTETKSGSTETTDLSISGQMGRYTIVLQNGKGSNPCEDDHLFNFYDKRFTVNLTLDGIEAPDNCSYMFCGCSGLTSLNLSNFDTSKVTHMGSMFHYCSGLTSLDLSNLNASNVTNMSRMFFNCSGLTSVNVSNFDTSNVTDMEEMFFCCSKLASLIVPSDFPANENVETGGIFDDAGSSVEGGKTTIYSSGAGTKVDELFSGNLRTIVSDYSNIQLSANVPEGHANETYEGDGNEIAAGSEGLALGDGVVVGFADGAVLKNYGSITGPLTGKAYLRLLGTATSATIINYCGGLEETENFSYTDATGSPKYYMLSEGSATFDEDNIEIQNRDGGDDQYAPKIMVTQSGSSNIGESDEIKSAGNIIVLASATSSEDPIEMSNSGGEIAVKAALANEIPEGVTDLVSRNIKISGAFNLSGCNLSHYNYVDGTFIAENATLTFGSSLPQTPSDFTNSNVTYQDGAEITKDITSTNGCLHFTNLKLKSGKITIKRN